MAIYKCKICGYVFDEDNIEEGLNIPAGTKFEDLPSSFKCPKCRMAKSMFEIKTRQFNKNIRRLLSWQNLNVKFADL